MNGLFELRLALRRLLKTPLSSLLAVVILALSACMCLSMYTIWQVQALEGPPLPNAHNLYTIKIRNDIKTEPIVMTPVLARELAQRQKVFKSVAWLSTTWLNFSTASVSLRPFSAYVSHHFFSLVGVQPFIGRAFTLQDEAAGATGVVIIGYDLWQQLNHKGSSVLGRRTMIHGHPHEIVGVMPAGFRYPSQEQIWLPMVEGASISGDLELLGELPEKVSARQGELALESIIYSSPNIQKNAYTRPYVMVESIRHSHTLGKRTDVVGRVAYSILLATLMLVTLNVAILLITCSYESAQEMALFQALGASPLSYTLRLMAELFILYFLGALLGLILTGAVLQWLTPTAEQALNSAYPYWWDYRLSANSLLVYVSTGVVLWLLASLLLGGKSINQAISTTLNRAGRDGQRRVAGLESGLLALQIALSSAFLSFTVGYAHELIYLRYSNYGVDAEHILTGHILMPDIQFPNRESQAVYLEAYSEYICELEGISACSFASKLPGPHQASKNVSILHHDDRFALDDGMQRPSQVLVGNDYFEALGIKLLAGRDFGQQDQQDTSAVVIIQSSLAEKLWPGESPLGKTLRIRRQNIVEQLEVVGVAPLMVYGLNMVNGSYTTLFRPFRQTSDTLLVEKGHFSVAFYTDEAPKNYVDVVQRATQRFNVQVPIDALWPIRKRWQNFAGRLIFNSGIVSAFSLLSVLLVFCSMYSLCRRNLLQTRREVAIFRALGACKRRIVGYLLWRFSRALGLGLLIGIPLVALVGYASVEREHLKMFLSTQIPMITLLIVFVGVLACVLPVVSLLRREPAKDLHDS